MRIQSHIVDSRWHQRTDEEAYCSSVLFPLSLPAILVYFFVLRIVIQSFSLPVCNLLYFYSVPSVCNLHFSFYFVTISQ